MIAVKIIWALVLAGVLGYSYVRAGKWEKTYGKTENVFGDEMEKQTFAFVPSSFFVIVILMLAGLSYAFLGLPGLKAFVVFFFEVTVSLSVYFLILLAVLPVLRTKISARACATMWVVPVMLFYNVYMLIQGAGVPKLTAYIDKNVGKIAIIIWLAGFITVFGSYIIAHIAMWVRIKRSSFKPENEKILSVWDARCAEIGYGSKVRLLVSKTAKSPFSTGLFKNTTVLPDGEYEDDELKMIFTHELRHLQRNDVETKLFLSFCNAICWFDPLVWIATKKASEDLELSCDEVVTESMDDTERREYAELLLRFASPQKGFTTCLSDAAETLRYRMKNVVDRRKLSSGVVILMVTMFLCAMSFGAFAITDERGTVGELLIKDAKDVDAVYVESPETKGGISTVSKWETELIDLMQKVEVEHISDGINHGKSGDRFMEFVCTTESERLFISVYDDIITVYGRDNRYDYYVVKSPIDWEKAFSYVETVAEIQYDDTFLALYIGDSTEPIKISQLSCEVLDNDTKNTLTAWSVDDTPTEISVSGNGDITLDMNFSPVKLTVTVLDDNGDEISEYTLEDFTGFSSIELISGGRTYYLTTEYSHDNMTWVNLFAFELGK